MEISVANRSGADRKRRLEEGVMLMKLVKTDEYGRYSQCSSITVLGFILCVAGTAILSKGSEVPRLDRRCFMCTCFALTKCKNGCVTDDKEYCGPYRITYPYWEDAGKLAGSFKDCTQDPQCAEETMNQYYRLYPYDCNGNGEKDCVDFFRIHLLGPHLCTKEPDLKAVEHKRWLKFLECYLNTANDIESALQSIKNGHTQVSQQ